MSVTDQDIRNIYPAASGLDGNVIVAAIRTAQIVVDQFMADCSYSDALKNEIQKYLAAHYLSVNTEGSSGGITRKRIGETEEEYRAVVAEDRGISKSTFGEQALLLDFEGCLSSLATRVQKARFRLV